MSRYVCVKSIFRRIATVTTMLCRDTTNSMHLIKSLTLDILEKSSAVAEQKIFTSVLKWRVFCFKKRLGCE